MPGYHVDWSGEHACAPALVLRPADTAAVSKALAYCHEHHLPVVTQGGMTGLSGGATPRSGEIVLSLERLNGVRELDRDSLTMTVRAGTPLQVVQQAAHDAGLRFPLDPAHAVPAISAAMSPPTPAAIRWCASAVPARWCWG
ncbi:MAG: FAD-dependent oxidoreductase [Thiolinea sp.]